MKDDEREPKPDEEELDEQVTELPDREAMTIVKVPSSPGDLESGVFPPWGQQPSPPLPVESE